jgi:hypothetical protein
VGLRGSVRLRISGDQTRYSASANNAWQQLFHEFHVTDDAADIEFVCDFGGSQGEAFFDLNSLKIRSLSPRPISRP